MPRFHSTFGEPIEKQPINIEMGKQGQSQHCNIEGIKLIGRIDHFEIDEDKGEVYVKDDYGVYIMYDCVLEDMGGMEEELLKIGAYYILKYEKLLDAEERKPYPLVDRQSLLEDLLLAES